MERSAEMQIWVAGKASVITSKMVIAANRVGITSEISLVEVTTAMVATPAAGSKLRITMAEAVIAVDFLVEVTGVILREPAIMVGVEMAAPAVRVVVILVEAEVQAADMAVAVAQVVAEVAQVAAVVVLAVVAVTQVADAGNNSNS